MSGGLIAVLIAIGLGVCVRLVAKTQQVDAMKIHEEGGAGPNGRE